MQLRASLAELPPYRKFLVLVGLTMICSVLFTGLGAALVKALYGIDISMGLSDSVDTGDPLLARALRLFQFTAALGTFLLPPLAAGFLFSADVPGYVGLRHKPGLQGLLLVFLLLPATLPFINWMIAVNSSLHLPASLAGAEQWMKETEEKAAAMTELLLSGTGIDALLSNLLVIALLPALGEELLFRGLIQRLFTDLTGRRAVAIVFTAFLFSALHLQFYGFLPRFALGLALGYFYVWSGSLWLPVAAHFFNNAAAVIMHWLVAREGISINPDTFGAEPGQEILLAGSVFLTWTGLWLLKRHYAQVQS